MNFRGVYSVRSSDKAALNDNEWLADLPMAVRDELIEVAKIRHFGAKERVNSKGQAADGLYGLLSGEVRVSAGTFSGDEIVFTRLRPGQWFGEIAILDGGVRTHDAHTVVASQIAILPRQALLDVCQRNAQMYRALVALLCEHCRQAFAAIDEFLVYSPEQRMARCLVERLPHDGSGKINISQSDLGALVGVSRQSTNKILKRWESRGSIRRLYGGVEVRNFGALQDLS